ncbi:FAD-binding and (Fe-S)-binding domain-containing protein [Actinomadura algeriensis]|uniref:FAD/FMN-containing dehydrogenase/Fe-S oxidoreductase n=1 Tax=Actinomadura algeriensis TaxID=1679523 RepID=A0ABR9K086_9ACTN|nr:FAD-binding and (Fe-S)-binding domain-containing protein [Actinomadura algeriensis]MBE1536241.1 FAD/FMN-containing dehydrogenase/Fe-S oxidoreductase [Actinomadura algeriensis]
MAVSAERTARGRPARNGRKGRGGDAGPGEGNAALRRALAGRVDGEVRFDAGSRAVYAHDSSNYQQPPIGVVVPYTVDAAAEAVRVCAEHDVPVLSRGGGTSLAGQCCNDAVVIDWSKYCTRLVSVDPGARTAVVEPGACLDDLNGELSAHGLMVGPKPSTHDTCTVGGMVGNNSCGASAQAYGKMVDSVLRLEILTYDGLRTWVGPTSDEEYARIQEAGGRRAEIYRALRALRDDGMEAIRTRYPDIPRRVSGYNLDSLLPEKGFDVARALVGSESTLVTVLRAEIRLFPVPPHQSLVVLGYDDITDAGRAVERVLPFEPLALEGMDDTLLDLAKEDRLAGPDVLADMPDGSGWLMVRFGGDTKEDADRRGRELADAMRDAPLKPRCAFLRDPAVEERLWKVREAGLGATAYPRGRPDTHEGWEDAAVPPGRLGDYLRDFRDLIREFSYDPVSLYGHFGQGCVHTRIPFDLEDGRGVERYREFVERAARLVASYGGSLSGEHGDGQSRGELLPIMFGDDVVALFGRLKAIFDPGGRMNPGKIVDPHRLDDDLDHLGYHPDEPRTAFAYPDDHHRFAHAAARCVGIGKCRASSGGVMCPSYRVTGEEEHSTRGRARILMEMMRGMRDVPRGEPAGDGGAIPDPAAPGPGGAVVITDGWRSRDVLDSLDLCLACKGCKSDCPVNVDMATYKAEFLHHHYAGRLRPAAHYTMGRLPLWARLAAVAPRAVNAALGVPGAERAAKLAGGIAPERTIPRFAAQRFTDWFKQREPGDAPETGRRVVLWPDTFTNNFHPHVGRAAVRVLEAAGYKVEVPPVALCCGLTWISTGQLDTAARVLRRTVRALAPRLRDGVPVVGLEPSCTAVFRSDAPELMEGDTAEDDVARLRDQTRTFAELLDEHHEETGGVPVPGPRGGGPAARAIAQPHCHQHAVMGFDADRRVLDRAGVHADTLDVGCCGLAGNFGFERGHHEVSTAIAEQGVWPAVRDAGPGTTVLADGFSCRTQIEAGTQARPRHLAELLADLLPPHA